MDKLSYIEELATMVRTGEIQTSLSPDDGAALLMDAGRIVTESIYNDIVSDITNPFTIHFSPDYPSWKHFLADVNGCKDYEKILNTLFTEKELDILWNNSHISESLSEEQIREQLIKQIGKLKMISLVSKTLEGAGRTENQAQISIKAYIKGLYNLLYE